MREDKQEKNDILLSLSADIGRILYEKKWRLVTAESCTGGWIAQAVTAIAGSSMWFEGGFVTYSNAMKQNILEVESTLLLTHGAVSQPVVEAMATGAIKISGAEVSIAVSGIAGPGGETPEKPVGTVWLAWCLPGKSVYSQCFGFDGDRYQVRYQSVHTALKGLSSLCREGKLCFNNN